MQTGTSERTEKPDTGDFRTRIAVAVRYWERRRAAYNLVLTLVATGWVVCTWPHFRPAFTLRSLAQVAILAGIANLCYTAAYFVDIPLQRASARSVWRRWRWSLWLAGTLTGVILASYWISDEIYPYVGR